jgi:two-component sensor histidine kinase
LTELALAAALASIAAAVRYFLSPLIGTAAPFALVFVAVVCATLLGGWKSGAAAALIGQALAWYLVVEPAHSFKVLSASEGGALAVVTVSELTIVAVVALYQREIDGQQRVREILVNELNHRVKNTLAVVQSLAHQTLRLGVPGEVKQFNARLQALAGAHNLLTRRHWREADLSEVIGEALRPFAIPADRISIRGPEVSIAPKTAVNLTLVIHELATNAIKYGALQNGEGAIKIEWTEGNGLPGSFVWQESGGPVVAPPEKKGFGTRLIERGLAAELGANVELGFRPDGLLCRIEAAD